MIIDLTVLFSIETIHPTSYKQIGQKSTLILLY